MTSSCQMDIVSVPGVKNCLSSEEGVFKGWLRDQDMCGCRQCRSVMWQGCCSRICRVEIIDVFGGRTLVNVDDWQRSVRRAAKIPTLAGDGSK
ncbi:MAG: hypothetical protein V8S26_10455 [Lachnospiraceae bacterium]